MKTALITGAFGQDGFFLTKHLLKIDGYKILCTSYSFNKEIDQLYKHKNVQIEQLDIKNEYEIHRIIKKYKPDEIYHLASFSAPIISWVNPQEVISVNGDSTVCILDAIRLFSSETKLFFASSAKIFGTPYQTPQTEDTPTNPLDPYSLGKYISHQAVKLYRNKFDIFACNGILYNHESYLKNLNFVVYKICHYAKLLKQNKITTFSLLNLNSTIDFGDPRDYVEAMYLILQQNSPDDYIISMKNSISIKDVCVLVGKLLSIPNILSHIKVEQTNLNNKKIIGDNTKLKKIGWEPKYIIEGTLKMILNSKI